MNKYQKGFAHFETLLLLIVVLLIAFIGWFVWHAKSQADKSLDNAANTNQTEAAAKKKTDAGGNEPVSGAKKTTKSTSSAGSVNFATGGNTSGVEISSDADIDKLDGASDSFKDFIKQKLDKNSHSPSPCGNAYGLYVKQIYKNNFALGDEKQCNNTEKLWARVSDQWTEIGSTPTNFDCSLLEQYKVPSAIVSQCIKNGQIVDNNQE